ncbi:integrase family protein [Geomonas sp. RF6]|uniref:integrase family protein n=1 Tax=Geomonas sp. RF6 TaxID=2897342 RepID=UPI001E46EE4C|nr:integrase family protein [Geomonas sp. RF6]UFS71361.1 integrase family protein [Geomonas sp. RF6]
MPKLKLTKANIDKIPSPEKRQVDYFDTELKGLGLRVSADYSDKKTGKQMKGARTFFVQIDVQVPGAKAYKTMKGKIGLYGEYTPEQARQKAPEIIKQLREGKPLSPAAPPTLRDVYDRYTKDNVRARGTIEQYRIHILGKFQSWLDVPLPELDVTLTPTVVIDRYQQVRTGSGPGAAKNAFKCLQALFSYGAIIYPQFVTKNPVKVISQAKLWGERQAREDCIEAGQFQAFYDGLLQFTPIHRDAFLLALYQGLRPNEAQSLEWADVNLEKRTAFIRHETEASKRSYTIPICRQTVEILERRKEAREAGAPYVFSSDWRTNKRGHITLRAEKLKQRTGLDLTVHGLRRTFITTGERLRLRREDINLLTGHVDGSVTGKHYSRLAIDDLRPTLQRIADEIERQVFGATAKVIHLRPVM